MQRRSVDEGSRQEKEDVEREARGFTGAHLARGNLGSTPFPEVMAQLYRWRSTGALLMRRDKVKKIVYVRDGYPIFIKSNLLSECLGQVMVRERMITQADCEVSIEKMQETRRQQGTLLIEMGIISPHNLHFGLQRQLETKLFEVFGWTAGDYQFNPKGEIPPSITQLEHTPAMLIVEGIKRTWGMERLKGALAQRLASFVGLHKDPLQRLQELELTDAENRLTALMDGTRTLREVLDQSPLAPLASHALCYGLLAAQVMAGKDHPGQDDSLGDRTVVAVQPPPLETRPEDAATRAVAVPVWSVPPPPLRRGPPSGTHPVAVPVDATAVSAPPGPPSLPPPLRQSVASPAAGKEDRERVDVLSRRVKEMRRMNYFEMLGISKNASMEEVKKAYFSQAKDFHPDKHFGSPSAEVKALADQIYSMLSTAYETLADARDRDDYVRGLHTGAKSGVSDEVGRILQAENRFQKGEGFMKKKDWVRAHQSFKEAVELYPDEGEFHSHLGWALFQTAPSDNAVSAQAEKHLEKGLALNSKFDRGYLFLGWLYKQTGRREQAEAQFEKAIQANPDCTEALRELRLLHEQKDGPPRTRKGS